ncbi:MAG: hypothetical protein U1F57_07930 [bacterium]
MKRLLLLAILIFLGAAAFPLKAEANRVFVTQNRGVFFPGYRPYYPRFRPYPYYPRYYSPVYFNPYYGYGYYPYNYTLPVFATPNPYFYYGSPGFGIAITP